MLMRKLKTNVLLSLFLMAGSAGLTAHAADTLRPAVPLPAVSVPTGSTLTPDTRPTIKFGILRMSLSPSERLTIDSTMLYLRRVLTGYRIEVEELPVPELETAIKNKECDFFLASSGFYRRVFHRGLRDLVTLTTPKAPDPNFASGSVFLVRKDSPSMI